MRYCKAVPIIIVGAIFFAHFSHASGNDNPLVTINIFSKQVRLLKEGSLPLIACVLHKGALIRDELNNEEISGEKVVLTGNGGGYRISIGARKIESPWRIKIYDPSGHGTFKARFSGEEREYPLPLVVVNDSGIPRFYVQERLSRYIVDSALAECGPLRQSEREAVLALAHIIRARYYYSQRTPQHDDARFCDLTHCQVYRGRIKTDISFSGAWLIDHEKLEHNLFFHSRCGGKTFGAGVFGSDGFSDPGVLDRLYRDGMNLCLNEGSAWKRTVSSEDLVKILSGNPPSAVSSDLTLDYNKNLMRITMRAKESAVTFPPETFRLKINRVKGWSFLKSNNYLIAEHMAQGKKFFIFQGTGLGHGAGLCQHGALSLSRLGYNRYEIIEHYFPRIFFRENDDSHSCPPYLSYSVFDLSSGAIRSTSHGPNFSARRVPPGSIFKIFIALYLAKERQDIFADYRYPCRGKNSHVPTMPVRCWKGEGHGSVGIREAIPNSCNLYFASLHQAVSFKKFKKFFSDLCRCLGVQADLPDITGEVQWANMLAGLDFRILFSINDYVRLVRFINADSPVKENEAVLHIPLRERIAIFQAMKETFTQGTASGTLKPYGSPYNYIRPAAGKGRGGGNEQLQEIWGKTATVLDGTNRPVSYGLFIGGCGDTGIVAVLRKGNGSLAARWARVVLLNWNAMNDQ